MTLAARIALLPVSVALAALAFIHAASENGILLAGLQGENWLGLTGRARSEQTDLRFRMELAQAQEQSGASGEIPRLSSNLLDLARLSFSVDPLEVSSLRTLVLGGIVQTDPERARRAMQLAAEISKRDSAVNLWRAQDFARRGNIEETLASFDQAMRTSSRVREFAMKPLVDTLASKESHAPLGKLLQSQPDWEGAFWKEFAQNPVAFANAAAFLADSGIPLTRMPELERQRFYANLKRAGQFGMLHRLAVLDPALEAKSEALAEGSFVTADEGYPLGWTLHSRGNYSSRIHPRSGELQIEAKGGAFGIAADRVLRLQRGRSFVVVLAEPLSDGTELRLNLNCASDEMRSLGTLTMAGGDQRGRLAVLPNGCEFGLLQLRFAVEPGRRDALVRIAEMPQI